MTTRVKPGRAVFALVVLVCAQMLIWYAAASLAETASLFGGTLSFILGILSSVLLGSLGEWTVHRYTMHTPWRIRMFNVPYELHHVASPAPLHAGPFHARRPDQIPSDT